LEAYAAWPDISNSWALAEFYLSEGRFQDALILYQSILVKKGGAIRWEQQTQWVQSYARAARCYRETGARQQALDNYNRFLEYWGSQTNLMVVRQALAERSA
jgi:tetratricopeptide (TPR) repeat protein